MITMIAKYLGPIWVLFGLSGAHIPQIKPRWDTHGIAHPKPTKPITHGPHINKMWDRCVLKLMGLLVGNTRWDTYGCAHQKPIRFETYGPHPEKMWGRCVLVLMGFGWASPDGTHMGTSIKNPQGFSYMGPMLKTCGIDVCWF